MIKPVATSGAVRTDATRVSTPQRPAAPEKASAPQDTAGTEALKAATQLAGATPPVDPDKVAQLRAAIEEGRYSLDPDAIAARMIALDLPQPKGE